MYLSGLRRFLALPAILLLALEFSAAAQAMPLFSRQTSLQCGMCHSPPPELTPFGRRFMLSGFTLASVEPKLPPVSAFFLTNYTSTRKDLDSPPAGSGKNHNLELQQATVVTGGRLADGVGAYVGVEYDGIRDELKMGAIDIRRVGNLDFAGKDLLYGIAVNNDPGYQDPWNSSTRRPWPYAGSALEPQPASRAALDGMLSRRVLGLSGYGFLDDSLYLEVAAYAPLSEDVQDGVGLYGKYNPELDGTGLYLRLAREHSLPDGSFTLGATFFDADIRRPFRGEVEGVQDIAVDAQYQRSIGKHEYTLTANLLQESIDTSASRSAGFAEQGDNDLRRLKLSASYVFARTYGLGVGYTSATGSRDPLYFGTAAGEPDTESLRLEVFANPLTRNPPKWYPWLRTRIGLQYVHFSSFDGQSQGYDGAVRDAKDNNSLIAYWLLVF